MMSCYILLVSSNLLPTQLIISWPLFSLLPDFLMSINPSMNVESNSTDKQSHCLKQNEYIHQCRNHSSTFWSDLAFLNQNKESRPGFTCKKLGSHHTILITSKNINRLKHQLFVDPLLGGAVTEQIFAKKTYIQAYHFQTTENQR